jgi:hypothetical protein
MGSDRDKSNTDGVCPFSGAGPGRRRPRRSRHAHLTRGRANRTHRCRGCPAVVHRAAKAGHAGYDLRGMDIGVRYGRDREARFGLMFKRLPTFSPDNALLVDLAQQMIDQTRPLSDVKDSQDGFNNMRMPAGYIYLGQFIDHDMTRDKTRRGGRRPPR